MAAIFFFFFFLLSFNAASQLPPALKQFYSPLTKTQIQLYADIARDPISFSKNLQFICNEAHLMCYPPGKLHYYSEGKLKYDFPLPGSHPSPPQNYTILKTTSTTTPLTLGLFLRESMLKTGTVMKLNHIISNWPERSFLPKAIESQIPFSTSKLGEIESFFNLTSDSALSKIIYHTLSMCETNSSIGEYKKCIKSYEDLILFATQVLGNNSVSHITKSSRGFEQIVKIGKVTTVGTNTTFAMCHQLLYPYIVYMCHQLPHVRVYKADFLDSDTLEVINQPYVVCHLNTSWWEDTHEAFVQLGGGPGKIEVCHWMDKSDVVWTN